MRIHALTVAGVLACAPLSAAQDQAQDPELPSIELLEYLADFEEDEQGRLLDPLAQAEIEAPSRSGIDTDGEYRQRLDDR